ncbi:hypothetical protein Pmani_001910 [Petrolisthes manimaculis]|uniref:Uncharacterized protein n=1 Tax=Petrolisthes manimaculis TaxID=1843537 RepID=A0AAE1QM14_9EUCA|nr:hypothetical protein Pmani_001910 [Petrolisthes manimaculis]
MASLSSRVGWRHVLAESPFSGPPQKTYYDPPASMARFVCGEALYSTLLYSTLLYSTLLYSTLLYSTLLYSTLLYSTLLYSTLLS